MRRASLTSEAVPAPPGKATTSTEAIEPGELWATACTDWPTGPGAEGAALAQPTSLHKASLILGW